MYQAGDYQLYQKVTGTEDLATLREAMSSSSSPGQGATGGGKETPGGGLPVIKLEQWLAYFTRVREEQGDKGVKRLNSLLHTLTTHIESHKAKIKADEEMWAGVMVRAEGLFYDLSFLCDQGAWGVQ